MATLGRRSYSSIRALRVCRMRPLVESAPFDEVCLRRATQIASDMRTSGRKNATNLALVEGLGLNLPLFLKTVHNILVTPADLVRQALRKTALA